MPFSLALSLRKRRIVSSSSMDLITFHVQGAVRRSLWAHEQHNPTGLPLSSSKIWASAVLRRCGASILTQLFCANRPQAVHAAQLIEPFNVFVIADSPVVAQVG
jgi:hypothetical protein